MGDLKPISHIQFNEFIKGKGFKGRSNYKSKDLKAMFGIKPLYDRRSSVISSKDMNLLRLAPWEKLPKQLA